MIVFDERGAQACETKDEACSDLRNRFLAFVSDSPGCAEDWRAIWRIVVEHPWYRAELASAAKSAIRRVDGLSEWREDVEQDAMLLLASKLRRSPGLGFDPLRARNSFGAWLGRIVRNDCRMAVRRLRRLNRGAPLPEEAPTRCRQTERERHVDLTLAVETLSDPPRTVLLLSMKGLPLREIADRMELSYWQVWRAYQSGTGKLRQVFGTGETD